MSYATIMNAALKMGGKVSGYATKAGSKAKAGMKTTGSFVNKNIPKAVKAPTSKYVKATKAGASTFARTKTGKNLIKNRGNIGLLVGTSGGIGIGASATKKKYTV